MKKFSFFLIAMLICSAISAQVPANYYNAAIGKSGDELRSALHTIITNNYQSVTYNGLWEAYVQTDAKSNGKVWDIYSDIPGGQPAYEYTFITDQCGNYSSEGSCYNREHSIPNSWFGGAQSSPMYSDLFHLYPTDGWVNNKRGNLPYGEVANASWTSTNGSKTGSCSVSGYTGTVFEPIDGFKGDLARTYFYMTVRYSDQNLGQTAESMFEGADLKAWALPMFLRWHEMDAVSEKEIARNNVIYNQFQHNRNPFIDCPELVDFLFGDRVGQPWYPTCVEWDSTAIAEFHLADYQCSRVFPNPASDKITVESNYLTISQVSVFSVTGQCVQSIRNVGRKSLQIDATNWKSGVYFVRITTGSTTETLKVVRE